MCYADSSSSPPSPAPPVRLARLCHRRWSLPILAALSREDGSKFVSLVYQLDAPRAAVKDTLTHLQALGLVMPNPGYGHPLRPEYILTPSGEHIGPACARLAEKVTGMGMQGIAYRKWFLPTLLAAHDGARRFGEYRAGLAGITDRALSFALGDLMDARMLARSLLNAAPPASLYEPTREARPLSAQLHAIVPA